MILEVESLEVRYGDVIAVRKVDLAVEQGQAVAVLGRNGAGHGGGQPSRGRRPSHCRRE